MAKLRLELLDKDGNKTVYEQDRVSGQKLLEYWNLLVKEEEDQLNGDVQPQDIFVRRVEYVASLFDNTNVTAEAIINGRNPWDLVDTVNGLIEKATGVEGDEKKLSESVQELDDNDF